MYKRLTKAGKIALESYKSEVIGRPVSFYDSNQALRTGIVCGVAWKDSDVRFSVRLHAGIELVSLASIRI